jgi:phytoene synthase
MNTRHPATRPAPLPRWQEASTRSSNLAFALFCLPTRRKLDAVLFYRFCRAVDDCADEPTAGGDAEKKRALGLWLEALRSRSLPPELEAVISRHAIDRSLLEAVVLGCLSDAEREIMRTWEDLQRYCWRVASAVGLVSLRIFGGSGSESESAAVELGHALQLTNILRDVRADAAMGRVYLPEEALRAWGASRDDVLALRNTEQWSPLLADLAARARDHFSRARFPREQSRAVLPALIMREIYSAILGDLEKDVSWGLHAPRRSSTGRKTLLALRVIWRHWPDLRAASKS